MGADHLFTATWSWEAQSWASSRFQLYYSQIPDSLPLSETLFRSSDLKYQHLLILSSVCFPLKI